MAFVLLLCAHEPADSSSFNRCSKKTAATSENRKLQTRVTQEQTELIYVSFHRDIWFMNTVTLTFKELG